MKPLVLIPARGGSKGVPRKNIKELNGKPLIQYTIDAVRNLFDDSHLYVSTDDVQIKRIVEQLGLAVPFIRPKELATDSTGTEEVILHAVQFAESQDYYPTEVILLQPTSPFRNRQHIVEAIETYKLSDCDMLVSVKETKSNPYYILFEESNNGYLTKSKAGGFVRRQDCPKVWELNGAIYIINVSSIKKKPISMFDKIVKYIMDETSSHDIDTIMDWKLAECIVKEKM